MIKKIVCKVAEEGGEDFIQARDKNHASSMRVTAFNYRKALHESYRERVGIQTLNEEGKWFVRIYDRKIDGVKHFVRDKETGKLVPVVEVDSEQERMKELMRKDGLSEEEIEQALKGEV